MGLFGLFVGVARHISSIMSIPDWLASIPKKSKPIDYSNLSFVGPSNHREAFKEFRIRNKQGTTVWNDNDIKFMEWIQRMFPKDLDCPIPDVRARTGIYACRHGSLIDGTEFLSLDEREQKLALEFHEKKKSGDFHTPMKNIIIPEDGGSIRNAIIAACQQTKEEFLNQRLKEIDLEHEAALKQRVTGKHFILDYDLRTLMNQVATCVRKFWMNYDPDVDIIPTEPSETLLKQINFLNNNSVDLHQGEFISTKANNWLPFLTYSISHLYLEHELLNKWPIQDVKHNDTEIECFHRWVKYIFSRDIPKEIFKQVREDLCAFYLPAGGKLYSQRYLKRSNIAEETLCQYTIGSNPTAELLSFIDDDIKLKDIANNINHPLYDIIACTAVSWYTQEMNNIDFDVDIMFSNYELLECYENLESQSVFGRMRGPLIVHMSGWKVQHNGRWYKTDTFCNSWLQWLKITYLYHKGKTTHDIDVSDWKSILSIIE